MISHEDIKGWQRKAESWSAPQAEIYHDSVRAEIEELPVYRVETQYPCSELPFAAPRFFIALLPTGQRFLVNTEGSNYARYIVALAGVQADPVVRIFFNDACSLRGIKMHASRLRALAVEGLSLLDQPTVIETLDGVMRITFANADAANAFRVEAKELADRFRQRVIVRVQ